MQRYACDATDSMSPNHCALPSSTCQEIGYEECLQNDLYCFQVDLTESVLAIAVWNVSCAFHVWRNPLDTIAESNVLLHTIFNAVLLLLLRIH